MSGPLVAFGAISALMVAYAYVVVEIVGRNERRDQVLGWIIGFWVVSGAILIADIAFGVTK